MKKSFGIVAILVFVLSFGSLVFAQNSNSSTSTGNMASTGKTKKSRKHRKARRHRRSSKKGGGTTKAKTGNANQ